jgi:hypothetical protein
MRTLTLRAEPVAGCTHLLRVGHQKQAMGATRREVLSTGVLLAPRDREDRSSAVDRLQRQLTSSTAKQDLPLIRC